MAFGARAHAAAARNLRAAAVSNYHDVVNIFHDFAVSIAGWLDPDEIVVDAPPARNHQKSW